MEFKHIPVLLKEICSYLPVENGTVGDFTIGGGGHSFEFLNSNPDLRLIGIDRDPEAIRAADKKLQSFDGRYELRQATFSEAAFQFREQGQQFHFILADLGFSSFQIDTPERGFSFVHDAPLDMRMNPGSGITAAHIVNKKSEKELTRIMKQYGEEQFARNIARQIVAARKKEPITTTGGLVECVKNGVPMKHQFNRIHPATKTFQALRIAVNDEIRELEEFLNCAIDLLKSGGRIAIISFHSLEDRPVKKKFREWENPCRCPTDLPRCVCGLNPFVKKLHKKIIQASEQEIQSNPRARSAKLRVVEKL